MMIRMDKNESLPSFSRGTQRWFLPKCIENTFQGIQRAFRSLEMHFKQRYKICIRLQNSPYFCVFKYARAVKQKVWNEAENRERDWGETPLSPHTPYGRVRLARFARIRLLRHALPISLLILRKKPTVLQSRFVSVRSSQGNLSLFEIARASVLFSRKFQMQFNVLRK